MRGRTLRIFLADKLGCGFVLWGGSRLQPKQSRSGLLESLARMVHPSVLPVLRSGAAATAQYETRWPWYTPPPRFRGLFNVMWNKKAGHTGIFPMEQGRPCRYKDTANEIQGKSVDAVSDAVDGHLGRLPAPAFRVRSSLTEDKNNILCAWADQNATLPVLRSHWLRLASFAVFVLIGRECKPGGGWTTGHYGGNFGIHL